jgi:hypothetical protein
MGNMAKKLNSFITSLGIFLGFCFLVVGVMGADKPHKPTVGDYLKFQVEVKELMIRANALPPDLARNYLVNNLTTMTHDTQFAPFEFEVHTAKEATDNVWIDLYYGSKDKHKAFRIRGIGVNKYGQIDWIEEYPENNKLPDE